MTVIEIASTAAAVLLAASRLLQRSEPLWSWIPTSVRWLPPVLVVAIPQIVQALGGAHTSLDLVETLILAITLIVPGARSSTHKTLAREAGSGPKTPRSGGPIGMSTLAVFLACGVVGCASVKPVIKSVYDIATEACVATFAKQKPQMSSTDIAKAFCTTAEDLQPFIDSLLTAQKAALARHGAEHPNPEPAQ
jgi:hypothetical protein